MKLQIVWQIATQPLFALTSAGTNPIYIPKSKFASTHCIPAMKLNEALLSITWERKIHNISYNIQAIHKN